MNRGDDWFAAERPTGRVDTRTVVAIAWRAIVGNASRSLLTALGVIIGVAAVVALTSLGAGVTRTVTDNLQALGTNLLTVSAAPQTAQGGIARVDGAGIRVADADALAALQANDARVAGVVPLVQTGQPLRAQGQNANATVVGTWPAFATVRNAEVERGAWFDDLAVVTRERVVVLGYQVARDLFGELDPIGASVFIGGYAFRVSGVLPDKGAAGFTNLNRQAFVPLDTYLQRLSRTQVVGGSAAQTLAQVIVQARDPRTLGALQADVHATLLARRPGVDPSAPGFQVQNQADALASLTAITSTLTLFLGAIAGISLLVGGIGIMNIMLVSVTERTREIGVRKALGARASDVRRQFLVEAVVLAAGGGLIGLALGSAGAQAVGTALGFPPTLTWQPMALAFGVSAFVGVAFGLYPAHRAASLDPVASLRHE